MWRTSVIVFAILFAIPVVAKERVIFDTDLGADCDDAGAFSVLHALADAGEIEILAMGIVNGHANAAPCADAINTWFGRPEIPIGTIKRKAPIRHDRYLKPIVDKYPHDLKEADAPNVVSLYRKVLAASEDGSITLIVVGAATNIADLLDSPADEISPMTGVELIAKKVKFYGAGGNGRGNLPKGEAGWNYKDDIPAAAKELELMPATIPFICAGGSGNNLKLGEIYRQRPADDIIRVAYENFHKNKPSWDRPTWDQLRVLYSCRPAVREHFETSPGGDITIDSAGQLQWTANPARNRGYAYVKDKEKVRVELERLMLHDRKAK